MSKNKKGEKLHLEMTRHNVEIIKGAVESYNRNPDRITPEIKFDHVVNEAINGYLKNRGY